jgi:hypothetical protein
MYISMDFNYKFHSIFTLTTAFMAKDISWCCIWVG